MLLRLRAAGLPGLALLESAGPLTPDSRFSYLSAAPTRFTQELPARPGGTAAFPAWLGGLKYEAALTFGLPAHPPCGPAQFWGYYPSGLVWDREQGTLNVVGEAHLDWSGLLGAQTPDLPELQLGDWSADDLDFEQGVATVQELIRAGEVYQVNLSRGVHAHAQGDPLAAYLRVAQLNPSPFMAYLELGDEVVVSASPERLVEWTGERISARPIAGTRRRGDTTAEDEALEAELRASSKEQAEHIMLLDLVRHDLGRAARPGSVWVPDLMLVERYSHVMHLVSEVRAQPRANLSVLELCEATFPGGTITGAPKRRVMQAIRDLEPGGRGWYTGSVGLISAERVDLNILIRTAAFSRRAAGWEVSVRAGAGVVIDSRGEHEGRETRHKAAALLQALTPGAPGRAAQQPELPRPGRVWRPSLADSQLARPPRVLFLDNFDSFTFNLVHDLQALGSEVLIRSATCSLSELLALSPSHVVIGPGPGTPQSSGVTLELTRCALNRDLPLLGVCLGHQALGEALGARVERAATPVHGQAETITHDGSGIFGGLEQNVQFTRYHSLVIRQLPSTLRVTARSRDGEVMGIEVPGKPAWGVQFHPESVLSREGRRLLGNFLRLGEQYTQRPQEHAAR
ncbi:glutamine amidotransferase of anthranilate synthase or aminodeoxychorismate synthase [Deinococcus peraridilitoris DSM 19664]|uniref:Glutamine amidotransferase of anthranilate synthase or aminodeoxychorismate synthase n=1 Tax=Deinococcus peraridilitoris (strain DSM 19664 / LMG 22246 / CIP 109416 / KR-200) TaxID=937777 RepID=L0A6B1_DEIPD|nr:glutamine amidotransferase of anthranilate synthase or aminodeoxychorismate synthase [Deinococcus peraridilitoris DSM 19664]